MADTLVHRGPDDEGFATLGSVGLGFRRLSIIDLESGAQPIHNETRDVVACVNGEIYNFRELRRALTARGHHFATESDAEVVVHLYEEKGSALVEDLVGMFAFAVVDNRGAVPRLLLGRDRLGIKPLYYAETEQGLVFASEAKAILATGWTPRSMRPEALLDYLVQGYSGGEQSTWEGIRRLPPASVLEWSAGDGDACGVQIRRYWDLPHAGPTAPSSGEEILGLLDQVVADRMVADVPLGAFLSGGIDSTAVVASMASMQDSPVVACSVGFEERSHDELALARSSARQLGAIHHTEVLTADPALAAETLPWFYDEPLADPSTVPTYLVSRMARQHVTVALSGDGGDETFGGYRRYIHDVAEHRLRSLAGPLGRGALRLAGAIYPRMDWAPRFLRGKTFLQNAGGDPAHAYWRSVTRIGRAEAMGLLAPDLVGRLAQHDPLDAFRVHYERPSWGDPLYRAQYADFHTYLPDQILTKVDRASMAVSLEVRVPILDHRFVERFAPLPRAEKVRAGRGKHAFRESLRGRVAGEVLDGVKRGFDTPLGPWIRGPLAGSVRDAVESLPDAWFNRARLRETFDEHLAGRRNHDRLLWSLFVLEQWRRRHEVGGLSA